MEERPPLLVVPANRGGSVEHFYHFLFGYLLPFIEACHPLRDTRRFLLRDCGPMNRLMDEMAGFEIRRWPAGMVLAAVVGSNPSLAAVARLVPPGFDVPQAYDAARLRGLRRLVTALFAAALAAADARHPAAADDRLVLLVDRAPPDPFYASGRAEAPGAGAQRRSIPNMAELQAVLAVRHRTLLVRLEELPFFDQVLLFSRAWRVVGQHGAGLAHMIWAREDAGLVEAVPTRPGVPIDQVAHVEHFRGLCRTLGLGWRGVPQHGDHARVEPGRVLAALEALG